MRNGALLECPIELTAEPGHLWQQPSEGSVRVNLPCLMLRLVHTPLQFPLSILFSHNIIFKESEIPLPKPNWQLWNMIGHHNCTWGTGKTALRFWYPLLLHIFFNGLSLMVDKLLSCKNLSTLKCKHEKERKQIKKQHGMKNWFSPLI